MIVKAKSFFLLLATFLFVFSCSKKDNIEQVNSSIEFSFELNTQSVVKSANADINATAIVVTIETLDGAEVCSNKRLLVSENNDSYKSQPLSIDPGTYKLTKFMVVDNEETVREVIPIGFSKQINGNDALPLFFEVRNGETVKSLLQVFQTEGKTPQDFGYVSFSLLGQMEFNFMMATSIFNAGTQKLENTSAHVTIENESVTLFDQNTAADTISITLNEEKGKYIISVSKDGYNTWKDTLSAYAFARYKSVPFSVILQKPEDKFIQLITNQDTISPLSITITQNVSSKLLVTWGDGIVETTLATSSLNHTYGLPGNYKVSIIGNIESFSQLSFSRCRISAINLANAINLASINISRNTCLHALDLSEKPNLKEVLCVEGRMESINLQNSNNIETLYCSMNNLASLDVTNLKNLKSLYCDRNAIASLDVNNNTALQSLCCYQNKLTSLNITNNVVLSLLECRNNKLISVDFSKNPNLSNISITGNEISNQQANNMLVTLLQSVKSNPRKGSVTLDFMASGAGENAMKELRNTYQWTVQ
jgi:hypothetical protein